MSERRPILETKGQRAGYGRVPVLQWLVRVQIAVTFRVVCAWLRTPAGSRAAGNSGDEQLGFGHGNMALSTGNLFRVGGYGRVSFQLF